jgi:uncharacterized protein YdcH (DUF465 family)
MSWAAALLAALKALPGVVDEIRNLRQTLERLDRQRTESKFAKLKEEVNELTKKIEKAKNNEERRALVRELNAAVSR